ncbi:MAG: hypothetical protein KJO92_09950 [Gammaproteobacteria bacterium]|nr:hypothetical protein [Gammaproteobacteria bacterium]
MNPMSDSAWSHRLPRALLALLFSFLCAVFPAGCATLGTPSLSERLQALPAEQKDRVHPFFINSPLDVPQIGRLAGVAAYFRDRGFRHSKFLFRASGADLAARSLDIRREDPDARIVLIGWSGASLWIWDALTDLDIAGQSVDLVVYLDSNWIKKRVEDEGHPDNYSRAVLIYRQDNSPVESVPKSVSRTVATKQHLAVAAHTDTLEYLAEELIELTSD